MKQKSDLKRAFLASVLAGNTPEAQRLAREIKSDNKPVVSLNIQYEDGIYELDGQQYNRSGIVRRIRALSRDHCIKYHFLHVGRSRQPDSAPWDVLSEVSDPLSPTITGMVII